MCIEVKKRKEETQQDNKQTNERGFLRVCCSRKHSEETMDPTLIKYNHYLSQTIHILPSWPSLVLPMQLVGETLINRSVFM